MRKVAVCVGINEYPSIPLSGCVNDAKHWQQLLESQGYEVTTLLDSAATTVMVAETIRLALDSLRFGDRFVFTFSGHGSWVPDNSGEEIDGRDEVLVMYDYQRGGLIGDDMLSALMDRRRYGVRVSVFSDSCHSGTVSRYVDMRADGKDVVRRFMPPSHFLSGAPLMLAREVESRAVTRSLSRSAPVLFSGCTDEEYSYDAYIDGMYQGAFSAAAHASWRAMAIAGQKPTYKRWHNTIRVTLPSTTYPQTPQLTASAWQRYWTL